MIKTVIDYLTKGFGEVCGCELKSRRPQILRPIPIVVASPHTLAFHWLLMGLSDVRGDNRESSAP